MYFFTSTILNWQNLLRDDKAKDIIINSLGYLSYSKQAAIHGFVIMPNHIHLLITVLEPNKYDTVTNGFIRFTAHEFKKFIKENYPEKLKEYISTQADRDFHFWERRPYNIKVESEKIAWQKLDYTETQYIIVQKKGD
ncbi:MAG: transposase [Bacteroidota bacterium]|nr:transposase [Bacteroidota bacterium]